MSLLFNPKDFPKIVCLDLSGHYPPRFMRVSEAEFARIKQIAEENGGYTYGNDEARGIFCVKEGDGWCYNEQRAVRRSEVDVPLNQILTVIDYE